MRGESGAQCDVTPAQLDSLETSPEHLCLAIGHRNRQVQQETLIKSETDRQTP